MNQHTEANNINRFLGYSNLYDQNRPIPPSDIVKILTNYLQAAPQRVADVGCGTGLSSFIWLNNANEIIGVEPNDDMLEVAIANWNAQEKPASIQFVKALSTKLPFTSESIDIITCSQSFHWMEPQATLREFARVLNKGGVFAAYDCDWPPSFNKEVEESYKRLISQAEVLVEQLSTKEDQTYKWNKEEHLLQIRKSGLFSFAKEIVFHNWETCDADRYGNIALSQGSLQTALKLGANDLKDSITKFRNQVERVFAGKEHDILFYYRMRIAVK
ncbi:SAM-dependent methyltransferase [Oceanobacillus arenosus]|uniref:SAM-dependent methyltransferase n=1 Tax=Oceanobacillus arenosus TaxID=1229153 RepID=A0A3D8PQW2_9BACI|nr:class I SAM-dependent methyltransferase [Oceanobacillus arenosus]RDW18374.1 SAM-dependent methyltransferase [Oceanobacillus arenosus]